MLNRFLPYLFVKYGENQLVKGNEEICSFRFTLCVGMLLPECPKGILSLMKVLNAGSVHILWDLCKCACCIVLIVSSIVPSPLQSCLQRRRSSSEHLSSTNN